jgi:hypothetical protein
MRSEGIGIRINFTTIINEPRGERNAVEIPKSWIERIVTVLLNEPTESNP